MRLIRLALAAAALVAGAAPASSSAATECPPNRLFNTDLPYVCAASTWDRYGNEYYVVGACLPSAPCRLYEIHLQSTIDRYYCRVPDAC